MSESRKRLTLAIGGHWMPMDLARLCHLIVRFYRFEQLFYLASSGGPNLFGDRFSPVILKYLAAFDWLAAPLMSAQFNESYERSEEFVRAFGVTDLRIIRAAYDAETDEPGEVVFSGIASIVDTINDALRHTLSLRGDGPFIGDDSQGRFTDIEAMYAANLRLKADRMRKMGYSDAELHAIISPSIEDLQFISNAMAQGKILGVENSPSPG